jgi:hypothetical protein
MLAALFQTTFSFLALVSTIFSPSARRTNSQEDRMNAFLARLLIEQLQTDDITVLFHRYDFASLIWQNNIFY